MRKIAIVLSLTLFSCFQAVQAQATYRTQVGLSLSMGSHIRSVGISLRLSANQNQVQGELFGQLNYQFLHMGSCGKGLEFHWGAGILYGYGEKDEFWINPHSYLLSNQTGYQHHIGYAYLGYRDQQQTSQLSGNLSIGFGRFSLRTENDFLGWESEDRYRTGAFEYSFWTHTDYFSIRSMIWTGDPYHEGTIVQEEGFPSNYGYLSMEEAPFGDCSVGILTFRYGRALPYGQTAFGELGWDAEQIRNFSQNKLVHDNPLLPINWGKHKNPHIPMLDKDQKEYLYKEGQEIRKARIYGQFGLNQFTYF